MKGLRIPPLQTPQVIGQFCLSVTPYDLWPQYAFRCAHVYCTLVLWSTKPLVGLSTGSQEPTAQTGWQGVCTAVGDLSSMRWHAFYALSRSAVCCERASASRVRLIRHVLINFAPPRFLCACCSPGKVAAQVADVARVVTRATGTVKPS